MEIKILKPRKALNKAFLKIKPNRIEIEIFKTNLLKLLTKVDEIEREENQKNHLRDFLRDTYYKNNHEINTKGTKDLVIHHEKTNKSAVGVIIEAKRPSNASEMLTHDDINKKAFQEILLYYLRERITEKNHNVKSLIISNVYEWFVFDEHVFEKLFAQNKKLVKQFEDFENGKKSTDVFYKEIAQPFIADMEAEIEFAFFDIREYEKSLRNNNPEDDTQFIALFKLLSPEHLLKLPFANDSNSLDKRFYGELLHIIGLSETKAGSKKLIQRSEKSQRNTGSFLENTIIQLDSLDKLSRLDNAKQFGASQEERLFHVALELCITWINRILFLKLLEAQLKTYHKEDAKAYEFLSKQKIQNYDDLNSLFFQVLAKKQSARNADVKQLFAKVPYLNSSLFEPSRMEHKTLFISNLQDDKAMPIYAATILKDQNGKKQTGTIGTLDYLLQFLNAYDFSSEGSEEIQEDNKTLINASVLGLIFEKINGYKDGSFFTPGFITMYMCRETIRKAVLQKFKEAKNWQCANITKLYNRIEDIEEANQIINSLKICDPAVGSGHFLVSALNEIIAIKNDLHILRDRDGKRLKEYHFEVVNDDLIITDEDGDLFEYKPRNKQSQRIQETIFHEKQTIIENCLFGVDINANSVKICRLRLWIELLKNAYYKNENELETLPNIDINIKCGNSLISRFALDANLKKALKSSKLTVEHYRLAVATYRNAKNKQQKQKMTELIDKIRKSYRSEIHANDPKAKKLNKLQDELSGMDNQIFAESKIDIPAKEKAAWNKKRKQLAADTKKLGSEIAAIKSNAIYDNAFEWRFEFPEVLNDAGDFIGFDVVIGNPPYIRVQNLEYTEIDYYKTKYDSFYQKADIYLLFIEKAIQLLSENNELSFINPTLFMSSAYGKGLRKYLVNYKIRKIIDFGPLPIFAEAITYTGLFFIENSKPNKIEYKKLANLDNISRELEQESYLPVKQENLKAGNWVLKSDSYNMLIKKLGEYPKLGSMATINSGCFTGYDDAFFVDKNTIAKYSLEEEIIKPIIMGKEPKKYSLKKPRKRSIYPYYMDSNRNTILNSRGRIGEVVSKLL